jgi:hypothetical protein
MYVSIKINIGMVRQKTRNVKRFGPLAVIALAVFVVVVGGILLWIKYSRSDNQLGRDAATTTSIAPSAQADYSEGDKNIPSGTPESNASGTDQNGSIADQTPPSSDWSSSSDGNSIVVYSPAKNGLLTSGSSVFGRATSNTVSYRLSDSASGLLTSGTANVVDGKFSIKLSFSAAASTGNVEVFNQTDPYSPESNNVIIPVRLQQ